MSITDLDAPIVATSDLDAALDALSEHALDDDAWDALTADLPDLETVMRDLEASLAPVADPTP